MTLATGTQPGFKQALFHGAEPERRLQGFTLYEDPSPSAPRFLWKQKADALLVFMLSRDFLPKTAGCLRFRIPS
jgi:hypothetical protein